LIVIFDLSRLGTTRVIVELPVGSIYGYSSVGFGVTFGDLSLHPNSATDIPFETKLEIISYRSEGSGAIHTPKVKSNFDSLLFSDRAE
jgi:hypothetical protein